MSRVGRVEAAARLMDRFARRTGLEPEGPQRRYLWTDAFAVCNYLGLHAATGEGRHLELALRLVDRVHHVLGRHRDDDPRRGWISGLSEAEGQRHPTAGGLRIGKPEPERGPGEPYEPGREWDRDGQYYHYLTRWMHALARAWEATGRAVYHRWAEELALASHRGFVRAGPDGREGGGLGLAWKMSVDLSRPLVPSMGQHDPLDGLVALSEIRASAPPAAEGDRPGAASAASAGALDGPIADLRRICRGGSWATRDALGIGGLLVDGLFVARLPGLERRARATGAEVPAAPAEGGRLLGRILGAAEVSLDAFARAGELEGPARGRLAFRELGLAIGLSAVERMPPVVREDERTLASMEAHLPLRRRILAFWIDPAHRHAGSWTDHRDINEVMLATSLLPEGYLAG